jgi:hypothetical protein
VDGGSQRLVLTKPFGTLEQASAVLAEIGSESGPLGRFTFQRDRTDDGTVLWRVRGAAGLPGGAADLSDADLEALLGGVPFGDRDVAAALGLTVRVQLPVLPSEVTATGASVGADGVVTFAPSLEGGGIATFTATGAVVDLQPERERESALRSWRWAAVAFAGGLLLLEAALFWRWLRRRRRRRGRH